jgi:hypothetical protein
MLRRGSHLSRMSQRMSELRQWQDGSGNQNQNQTSRPGGQIERPPTSSAERTGLSVCRDKLWELHAAASPLWTQLPCARVKKARPVGGVSLETTSRNNFFFFFFFETGFLCILLADPGTHSVDQAGLELRNPPASASRVLGLKACATTPGSRITLNTNKFLATGLERWLNRKELQLLLQTPWVQVPAPTC